MSKLDALFQRGTEDLAQEAQQITRQYWGRAVSLFAPLYISNFCENGCIYCGFSSRMRIKREKLTPEQIDAECQALAATGIQNVLLLTGESHVHSPLSYLIEAVEIAKKYFPNIGVEVQPMDTADYRQLVAAGVDGMTCFQETYDEALYPTLHPLGRKHDYRYRLGTPYRAAEAGIRRVGFGALLGLNEWRPEVEALFAHVADVENRFPGTDIAISFPRLLPIEGALVKPKPISDEVLVRIMCIARILFPRVCITLSTRENARFRDNVLPIMVTQISAASATTVGGYARPRVDHDGQFAPSDERSLAEVKEMLLTKGYDPVFTDWRRL
ncbi:MAG: 2-iminoacetate synthase ThiH [Chthoniobacteraceae bacterium]